MTSYRQEQLDGYRLVLDHLDTLGAEERQALQKAISPYLDFRKRASEFLDTHFAGVCTQACYDNQRSACCSKDGIVTFFADIVVNALVSDPVSMEKIMARLGQQPHEGFKCIYLGPRGCLWQVKPLVCEMFLCDPALSEVFGSRSDLNTEWEALQQEKKRFSWPDRPVLFDHLEAVFIEAGLNSSLMYLHNSPGLLRVKRLAGLYDPTVGRQ
ncbi:MAG: hypothetical protein JEZ11_03645 [Desulfobacterales bacterium]|nr:hypothetical protein [Desulfobacterales bacterium]